MSEKVIIAKPGFNALTETNPDNLIFSSDYDTLKYDTFGVTSLTVDFSLYYHAEAVAPFGTNYYNRKVVTVAHNLGYIPFFIGYLIDYPTTGDNVQLPILSADSLNFGQLNIYADSTNLYFVYYSELNNVNSGTSTFNLKYRIFKNDLGL